MTGLLLNIWVARRSWKIRHRTVIPVLLACSFGHHFWFKFFNYPDVDMEESPHILELLTLRCAKSDFSTPTLLLCFKN